MPQGRKPNYERRRPARKLRERGLSHAEIGKGRWGHATAHQG
jgi:hypothetical protein